MTKRNFTWWHNTFAKLTSHNQHTFQILLAPCSDPGFPANGNGQWRNLKHNSWVTFSCNKKYQLEGRRQIQCKDGIWSGNRPKCVGKKIRIRCSFEKISEKYHLFCFFREIVSLFYLLVSSKVWTCIHIVDILWQPHATPFLFLKFFSCLFWSLKLFVLSSTYFINTAVCPDPGEPLKGKRYGSNFKNGSTITFTCNIDHELIGNNTIRCEDGVWSGSVPICKGMVLY